MSAFSAAGPEMLVGGRAGERPAGRAL